jgi:hypothetical protein
MRCGESRGRRPGFLGFLSLGVAGAAALLGCADHAKPLSPQVDRFVSSPSLSAAAPGQGQYIFRHWTFGDETFWTDTLQLHRVVEAGVSPALALAVGLKVDADRLPPGFLSGADLASPATTVELLRRDAVVGLEAKVTAGGHLASLGVTCALCHSTVDNSATAGVGRRLDGLPNRDLNVGAIIALSPAVPPALRVVFNSWGPGRYDAEFNRDGINSPVVIPPALGLRGVALETYTAEGPVSYWKPRMSRSRRCTAMDRSATRHWTSTSARPPIA